MQDRLAAAWELANRLYSRPVQAVEVDDGRPTVPVFLLPDGEKSRSSEIGDSASRISDPATNKRLVEVKTKYGPENVFRINQNIVPRTH
jgi:Berberine and berberine like